MRMSPTTPNPRSERNGRAGRAMRGLRALLLAALALALAAPALAGSVYRWETPEGGLAFTDDRERIPARHRETAERVELKDLEGYSRYTPKSAERETGYAERLAKRLERLQALYASAEREAAPRRAAAAGERRPGEAVLELRQGMKLRVPTPEPGEAGKPLVIEEVRVREPGGSATKTDTVVRRGDEVFVVVSPLGRVRSLPSSVPSEEKVLDLHGERRE